jgi:hypothetical protein
MLRGDVANRDKFDSGGEFNILNVGQQEALSLGTHHVLTQWRQEARKSPPGDSAPPVSLTWSSHGPAVE